MIPEATTMITSTGQALGEELPSFHHHLVRTPFALLVFIVVLAPSRRKGVCAHNLGNNQKHISYFALFFNQLCDKFVVSRFTPLRGTAV